MSLAISKEAAQGNLVSPAPHAPLWRNVLRVKCARITLFFEAEVRGEVRGLLRPHSLPGGSQTSWHGSFVETLHEIAWCLRFRDRPAFSARYEALPYAWRRYQAPDIRGAFRRCLRACRPAILGFAGSSPCAQTGFCCRAGRSQKSLLCSWAAACSLCRRARSRSTPRPPRLPCPSKWQGCTPKRTGATP